MSLKITAIDLQNFQSHTRTRIPVGDFTILMGLSSAGKTTILRALQFLFYGDWDATYPNDDKLATAVAIEFENGTRVIRMRKGGTNSAAVSTTADGVTKYKSFGAIIPGMYNILNVKPIDIGNKAVNLNFSMQDDPIFMVSESRPIKAQWLGRLYGAHVVNEMLKLMSRDKTRSDGKRKDSEERLAAYAQEMLQYNNLEEHAAAVEDCKTLMAQAKTLKKLCDMREMLAAERRAIEADSWVISADLKSIKEDIRLLAAMKLLSDKKAGVVEDREFIKRNALLLKTDLSKMRKGVQMIENLTATRIKAKAERVAIVELGKEWSAVNDALFATKDRLNKSLFSEGNCPACGHEVEDKRFTQVAENIKRLI
jgi:hypothetical protein